MANPDPEITPEEVRAIRGDAIVATGRSDYPNQVNNVLGFPYIFRGALDVRASTINEAMKIAAAQAIAALAREEVPDEVTAAYRGPAPALRPGISDPDAVRPAPDRRRAGGRRQSRDGERRRPAARSPRSSATGRRCASRLDPTASRMQLIIDRVQAQPKRVVFAEGEEEKSISAALAWRNGGLGMPVLIGREERIAQTLQRHGPRHARGRGDPQCPPVGAQPALRRLPLPPPAAHTACCSATASAWSTRAATCFGACMVAHGHADAMITGLTRTYHNVLEDVLRVVDPRPG